MTKPNVTIITPHAGSFNFQPATNQQARQIFEDIKKLLSHPNANSIDIRAEQGGGAMTFLLTIDVAKNSVIILTEDQ